MRKLLVGFISLGAVLAVYLLYTGVSDTPVIDTDPGADFAEIAADSNMSGLDGEMGNIGGVGIGTTQNAYFININKETNVLEREWGFAKLLHEARGYWELEKPYVNVFEPDFTCYITADKGQVQVETAVGRTTPKDAMFSGNVVIHMLPTESSDMKESFVYLDNMTFLSERSQLSTKGPVEYVSEDVRMRGTGLEIVYNELSDRIEFFRIDDLESLRVKSSQMAMFSADETASGKPAESADPNEALVAAAAEESADQSTEDVEPQAEQEEGVFYRCILSKNVLIDTPDELIFADNSILINEIFWPKDSRRSSGDAESLDANDTETVVAVDEPGHNADPDTIVAKVPGDSNVAVAAPEDPNQLSEETVDIVITCDNGLVLVPADTVRAIDRYIQGPNEPGAPAAGRPEQIENNTEQTVFTAPRIDYDAVTGDVVAEGLSQLTLYTGDSADADANEPPVPTKITARDRVRYIKAANEVIFEDCLGSMPQDDLTEQRDVTFLSPEATVYLSADKSVRPDVLAAGPVRLTFYIQDANDAGTADDSNTARPAAEPVPVTVTAQKQARFSGIANRLTFEDDCRVTTFKEDPNGVTQYMLLSELITVELPEDTNDGSTGRGAGIERLTATGGVVRLATTRTAKPDPNATEYVSGANATESLGGVELKCSRVDYDPVKGMFVAAGAPAQIWMDNSKVTLEERDPNGFSLGEPCYVLLENFDTLKYFINENRIVADAGEKGTLWLHYIPVVDGEHDLDAITTATAPRVEAVLVEGADGRTELASLAATGGIDFNDLANGRHFLGSELFYDHKTAIMEVTGDLTRPCIYNGALVDYIKYNVNTGWLDFDLVAPGAFDTNQ
ncbi:MAG: hypothetical protein ACYS7Y_01805 [Planctomycetota bacterium]|jgi:hypothetical protein